MENSWRCARTSNPEVRTRRRFAGRSAAGLPRKNVKHPEIEADDIGKRRFL